MVPSVEDAPVTNRFALHTRFICTVSVIVSIHRRVYVSLFWLLLVVLVCVVHFEAFRGA